MPALTRLGNYDVHPHSIGLGSFQWLRVSIRQPGVMELKYSFKLTIVRRNLRLSDHPATPGWPGGQSLPGARRMITLLSRY